MTTTDVVPRRSGYGALWRAVPRELGFLALTLPIAVVGFTVTVGLFSAAAGTAATVFLGIFFLIATLYVSRAFGVTELARLRWAGMPPIEHPRWEQTRPGFWGWVRELAGNGHYWLYLLHTMVVNFAVSLLTWVLTITWLATGLGGATFWFWDRFIPNGDGNIVLSEWVIYGFGGAPAGVDLGWLDALLNLVVGVIFLVTLPLVTRGLTRLHWLIARGMLAAFASDALRAQVGDLTESRGAAISAEGHSLRRLERDIHDGPQQRLVRMQMDLAAADRQLDTDPERARELIAEAMQQSRDALEELRALSRGFAPPILLDRGLVAALESAADRSPIPTRVVDELGAVTLPQEIERNAYFVASEAMANAAKHSRATDVEVRVQQRLDDDNTWLDIVITDNGGGGAVLVDGHGLVGLQERLRGLGGTIEVKSPAGGPTIISAHLPVMSTLSSSVSGVVQP